MNDNKTTQQDNTTRQLTLGERRVGITFNPSSNPQVDKLKRMGADFIDACEEMRDQAGSDGEIHRRISEAQTNIETGTMYAVKANFPG